MANQNTISAREALNYLCMYSEKAKALDVRSEGEFLVGRIPHFVNIPILNNSERHEVGVCYKKNGQDAAIHLGHILVNERKETLIQSWKEALYKAEYPMVTCWRGGLRSSTAIEWLKGIGIEALQIRGGYKSLRRELIQNHILPMFIVVSGPTGSGKTHLIHQSKAPHLDLENFARHRGSAFGELIGVEQISQASFENEIAFFLYSQKKELLLIEDESLMIGKNHLPSQLHEAMISSPIIKIKMNIEDRVANIFDDYIKKPMEIGISPEVLCQRYISSARKIERKMGGLMTSKIISNIEQAFSKNSLEIHQEWIRELLVNYYDKAYAYSFAKYPRKITYEGNWSECLLWIQKKFA